MKKSFKGYDIFDRRRRIIFDQKSGDIIQYQRPEDEEKQKAEPGAGPEEPEDENQLTLDL